MMMAAAGLCGGAGGTAVMEPVYAQVLHRLGARPGAGRWGTAGWLVDGMCLGRSGWRAAIGHDLPLADVSLLAVHQSSSGPAPCYACLISDGRRTYRDDL